MSVQKTTTLEAAHATAYYRAQRDVSYQRAHDLQDELTLIEEKFHARKAEVDREIAALQADVDCVQRKLNEALNEHETWTGQHDRASSGYHSALDRAAKAL